MEEEEGIRRRGEEERGEEERGEEERGEEERGERAGGAGRKEGCEVTPWSTGTGADGGRLVADDDSDVDVDVDIDVRLEAAEDDFEDLENEPAEE